MSPSSLAELISNWGYPTYVLLLGITGIGSPVPEDLILATAGYLVSAGVFSWPGAIAAGIVGVVGSDAMLYGWGRRIRAGAGVGWVGHVVKPRHMATAERWLARVGDKGVFLGRLLPGTRAVAFIGAGLRGMPFPTFLLLDAVGALIWVPFVLMLGAQLGEEIGGLDRIGAWMDRFAWWIGVSVVLLAVLWRWWRVGQSKL